MLEVLRAERGDLGHERARPMQSRLHCHVEPEEGNRGYFVVITLNLMLGSVKLLFGVQIRDHVSSDASLALVSS